jgi:hypothetical protein
MVGRHCCLLETTYTYLSLRVQVLDKYNHKVKIAGLDDMMQTLEYAVKMGSFHNNILWMIWSVRQN